MEPSQAAVPRREGRAMWIFYSTQNFQCDQKVPEGGPNERQRLLLLRLLFEAEVKSARVQSPIER